MLGAEQCPLFRVERCPFLGGSKCICSVVKSIGCKCAVRCTEVVRFSEGPLLDVSCSPYQPCQSLYVFKGNIAVYIVTDKISTETR